MLAINQFSIFDTLTAEDAEKVTPKKSDDWRWTFSDYPKEKNGLKVFSCFACGGGSTMGYKFAGCDVIGCCEIDPRMNEVYKANHDPEYNYLMDIRDFNKLDDLPPELYDLDILDGSPPCTTFSTVGKREETWGVEKKFREGQAAQTLDDLSFIFIETVRKLQPKVVIMENVEGILIGNAYEYVKKIYADFNDAGYRLWHWLMKGETMGVPQTRHRVFFVGIRKDLKTKPQEIDMDFNYMPIEYGRIKSGHGQELNKSTLDYKMLCIAKRCDKNIADVYKRIGEKERRYSAAICWDENVMPTIVAKLFHYRGDEKTKITTADIIHAQTFPEDYNFLSDSFNNVAYICGMSVPPIMIKRIVTRLIEQGVFDYKLKE